MANLSQLQMPSIDTGQLSGKDGKKIKSYLFQIQEMLRYALNDIDEDNLSEELRSKIESGGLSSEISQALDAITLRVTGLDDAQAELKLTAEGLTSQVEAQGGRISTLEQTATSITARVETAEGDITTLEQTATSLTGRIESAEGDINTLTATATGLEGRIESAEGSITTLTATADGLSTRVESAEGNITSLTQTADSLKTRVESAEGDITTLTATAEGLKTRVTDAEGNITTLTATANGLTTRVESAEGDVTTIKQWADSLTLSVANGDSSSTIRLMAGSTEISSGSIGFTGVVTFSDLSTWQQDKTIINGGNITTGQMIDERVRQLERADEEAAAQASRMMEAGTLTREEYDSVLDSARDAKELRTAIRSAITKEMKPRYQAADTAGRQEIAEMLCRLKVDGLTVYEADDFKKWE